MRRISVISVLVVLAVVAIAVARPPIDYSKDLDTGDANTAKLNIGFDANTIVLTPRPSSVRSAATPSAW